MNYHAVHALVTQALRDTGVLLPEPGEGKPRKLGEVANEILRLLDSHGYTVELQEVLERELNEARGRSKN